MAVSRNFNALEKEAEKKNFNHLFALEVFRINNVELIDKIDMSVEFFIAKNNSRLAFDKFREKFTPSYDFYVYAGYFSAYNFIDIEFNASNQKTLGFLKGCAQSENIEWALRIYKTIKEYAILDCMYFYFLMHFHRYKILDEICDDENIGEIITDILPRLMLTVLPCPQIVKYLLKGMTGEKLLTEIFEYLTTSAKNEELYFDTIKAINLDNKIVRRLADQFSLYKIKREFC